MRILIDSFVFVVILACAYYGVVKMYDKGVQEGFRRGMFVGPKIFCPFV